MNILTIGNSFSQDATRYLHQIAKSDGKLINVTSLVIGGCSLYKHFQNIKGDQKAYGFEFNGVSTGFLLSIREALLSREWDVITIQQVSTLSPKYESFQPYLNICADYIREYCPKARLCLHQVWSYEDGGDQLKYWTKYETSEEMFADTKASYDKAFTDINADGLIPSGELMLKLAKQGFKIHRDGFHASLGFARYALALLWYSYLSGSDVTNVSFNDFDEEVTPEQILAAKNAVNEILSK